MIILYTGRPGAGKTYKVVSQLLNMGKKYFIYHNVDGLKEGLIENGEYIKYWPDIPGFLGYEKQIEICKWVKEQYSRSVLVIIDEAQNNGFDNKNSDLKKWLSWHRHNGQDIWLIAQHNRMIHLDYVNICEYEVRAKKGIVGSTLIYQYSVGGEVFKTERTKKSNAVFSAYRSFDVKETGKKTSPYLWYVGVAVFVAVGLGFYQLKWGIPGLFGQSTAVAAVSEKTKRPPGRADQDLKGKVAPQMTVTDEYSYCGYVGGQVLLQKKSGATIVRVSELYPGAVVMAVDHRSAMVNTGGKNGKLLLFRKGTVVASQEKSESSSMGGSGVNVTRSHGARVVP